jgi:hypothetical protein
MTAWESINTATLKIEKPITFVYWKMLFSGNKLQTDYFGFNYSICFYFKYILFIDCIMYWSKNERK